jgi:arsenate reductase
LEVVEYLKTGWSRETLKALLKTMRAGPRDILRRREPLVKELGLDNPLVNDDDLLDAMVAHPVLVERPIVTNAKGAVLCRPLERLDALF